MTCVLVLGGLLWLDLIVWFGCGVTYVVFVLVFSGWLVGGSSWYYYVDVLCVWVGVWFVLVADFWCWFGLL